MSRWVGVALLAVAALAVPMWQLTRWFGNNTTDANLVYYVATWFDIIVLGFGGLLLRRSRTAEDKWVAGLLCLTCVGVLSYWFDWASKSYDYSCYEHGAMAIEAGLNPYLVNFGYPPPLAQVLATLHSLLLRSGSTPDLGWRGLYVAYEGLQMGLGVVAVWLTWRVLTEAGVARLPAAIATSVAYLLNAPLRDTVLANQVNVMLLVALLLFLRCMQTAPLRAGACLALATCLKPFLAPLWLGARPRVVAGMAIVLGAIGASVLWDHGSLLAWRQYVEYMRSYPVERYWVNISVSNEAQMLGNTWHWSSAASTVAGYVVVVGVSILLAVRLVQRYRTLRTCQPEARRRLEVGQVFELMTLAMVYSPKVWYHHFLLFAPLVALALGTQHTARPGRCLLAVALTQGLGNNVPFPLILHPWLGVALALSLVPVSIEPGP